MKQLAWLTAVALATITVLFLLWEFRTAVFLFILSLVVTSILRPIIDFLTTNKLPRSLAVIITYLAVIVGMAALTLFMLEPLMTDLQALATDLPMGYEQLQMRWLASSGLAQTFAQNFPNLPDLFQTITGGQWNIFMQSFLDMTLVSLDLIASIIIVFALSIYWSMDQEHFKRLWLSLLPSEIRTHWRDVGENIESKIGAYLRSEIIQSLLTLIFLQIGYQLIGLKYPALLALFGAIGWSIAWFGGVVVVFSVLLVGFLTISPAIGLQAALITIIVLSFLEFVVEPKLFKREHLSSLLVLIMVLLMVKQYGIVGFFIAPPLAAAISILAAQLFKQSTATTTITLPPPPTVQFDLINERLASIQVMIANRAESAQPEIINLMDRLDKLVSRANHDKQLME